MVEQRPSSPQVEGSIPSPRSKEPESTHAPEPAYKIEPGEALFFLPEKVVSYEKDSLSEAKAKAEELMRLLNA